MTREYNERVWTAWHIGALQRATKRYPSLNSMLIKPKEPMRQTWQQQLTIARMWSARRLGKITTRVN